MLYRKEIEESREQYDLIVCGAGMSGFAAALAAAESGGRVLLIERGTCIGGTATQGLVNHILGGRTYHRGELVTSVGGIYRRLEERLLANGAAVDVGSVDFTCPPHGWYAGLAAGVVLEGERCKLILEEMLDEAGVTVLYGTSVVDVVRHDRQLEGVIVHNKSGLSYIKGAYFADATGDADLCAMAGCPFAVGDENGGVAPASMELHVENVDVDALTDYMRTTGDVRFRALIEPLRESGVWDFPYDIFISVMLTERDVFMINTNRMVGVDGLDARSITRGILDARRENFRLLEIMRAHFPGFRHARVRGIAPMLGIRESRRIEGEYVLTVEDLLCERSFSDAIAYSVYGWDLPDPKRPSHQPDLKRHKSLFTPIPYRCLLPKGVENLIAVGRCISVERPVLGPVRVMAPCLAMGEAAGCAAALARAEGVAYREVSMELLRARLLERGAILQV